MNSNLVERFNRLNDTQAIKFLQYFNQGLLDGVVDDLEPLFEATHPSIKALPGFSRIEHLSLEEEEVQIDFAKSVEVAREILEALAQEPTFSPLLEKALDSYADREASVETILAVGLTASMILLVSTKKSFKFKGFGVEIDYSQGAANPAVVETVMNPLANLPGKLPIE